MITRVQLIEHEAENGDEGESACGAQADGRYFRTFLAAQQDVFAELQTGQETEDGHQGELEPYL